MGGSTTFKAQKDLVAALGMLQALQPVLLNFKCGSTMRNVA